MVMDKQISYTTLITCRVHEMHGHSILIILCHLRLYSITRFEYAWPFHSIIIIPCHLKAVLYYTKSNGQPVQCTCIKIKHVKNQPLILRNDLFWSVVDESLLSLGAELSSLLLQGGEPVEHGVLVAGLQGHNSSVTGYLKLMLAQVFNVVGEGSRGYLDFTREREGGVKKREREREREKEWERRGIKKYCDLEGSNSPHQSHTYTMYDNDQNVRNDMRQLAIVTPVGYKFYL